jgi:hypothetical protein
MICRADSVVAGPGSRLRRRPSNNVARVASLSPSSSYLCLSHHASHHHRIACASHRSTPSIFQNLGVRYDPYPAEALLLGSRRLDRPVGRRGGGVDLEMRESECHDDGLFFCFCNQSRILKRLVESEAWDLDIFSFFFSPCLLLFFYYFFLFSL